MGNGNIMKRWRKTIDEIRSQQKGHLAKLPTSPSALVRDESAFGILP